MDEVLRDWTATIAVERRCLSNLPAAGLFALQIAGREVDRLGAVLLVHLALLIHRRRGARVPVAANAGAPAAALAGELHRTRRRRAAAAFRRNHGNGTDEK